MQTKIQFTRGNFSTFISRARSNIDNPLPPNIIVSRAAEKLLKDFGIEVQPEDLIYDKGIFKGEFDANRVRTQLHRYIHMENLEIDEFSLFKKFCAELDEECYEINLKRNFPAGMPFINMDGDKVDLIISCGDNYIARVPMERMTINKYLELKDSSKNKLRPSEISNNSWLKDVVDYLKDVKCKDSDEQRKVDNLIDNLLLEVNTDNTTNETLSIVHLNKQLYKYLNDLENKNVYPIIKSGKIFLVKAEPEYVGCDVGCFVITDAPDSDFVKRYGTNCVMALDKDNNKIDLKKEDLD